MLLKKKRVVQEPYCLPIGRVISEEGFNTTMMSPPNKVTKESHSSRFYKSKITEINIDPTGDYALAVFFKF